MSKHDLTMPPSDHGRRPSYEKIVVESAKKALPADANAYNLGCKIGSGSFGFATICLAKRIDIDERKIYAVKKLEVNALSLKELKNIQDEIALSSRLNHPCILPFFATFVVNRQFIWTIFPLYSFGSCRDVIATEFTHGLPLLLVAVVLRSMVLALEYLHKLGIIHRAVNGTHILLNADNTACLSGLRHCLEMPAEETMAHHFPDDTVKSLPWVAPEILEQSLVGYNDRSDIYSLGITAVELVTGTIPYSKLRPTEILLQKLRGVVPQLPDKSTIEEMQGCDLSTSQSSLDGLEQTNDLMFSPMHVPSHSKRIRNLQQFVDVCLQSDFNSRPSASQLRQCSYIRNIKKKMKDKDCTSFTTLLHPLQPIVDCVPSTEDTSIDMELVDQMPNVDLQEDVDVDWVF